MTDDQEKRDAADAVTAALTGQKRLEQIALSGLQKPRVHEWLGELGHERAPLDAARLQAILQIRHNQLLTQQNKLLAELVALLKDRK